MCGGASTDIRVLVRRCLTWDSMTCFSTLRSRPTAKLASMNDTHPAAQAVQIELLRQAGATRRASIALRLSQEVVERSRRALSEQVPGVSQSDVLLRWVDLWYGRDLGVRLRSHMASRASRQR